MFSNVLEVIGWLRRDVGEEEREGVGLSFLFFSFLEIDFALELMFHMKLTPLLE